MAMTQSQKALSLKATAYVQARLEGLNPPQASTAAGYSRSYAKGKCYTLEQDPSIRREIRKGMARLWKQHGIRLNRAMEVLGDALEARVSDMVDPETGEMLPPNKLPKIVDNVIDGYEEETTYHKDGSRTVKRRYKKSNKLQAADMAFKIKGAYAPEKLETRNLTATIDYDSLCEAPQGALEPDVIEVEAEKGKE